MVKWLRKGGQVDALCPTTTRDGQATAETLLHVAAGFGHLELVKELLERGASVNLQNSLGWTALMDAAGRGHLSILFVLLHHSASIDLQDIDGVTALMRAADQRQQPCVKALLRAKANPDLQDKCGITALMYATDRGWPACVLALLRAKANAELLDKDGRTALQCAESNEESKGHTGIAELIRQHAALPCTRIFENSRKNLSGRPFEKKIEKSEREEGKIPRFSSYTPP